MGSKTIAKSVKAIAVKKENPQRNANPRTKIAKPTITAKIETPLHPDDKPRAKLKKSIATKIETPQSSQSDDKSNAKIKEFHCDEDRDPATLSVKWQAQR